MIYSLNVNLNSLVVKWNYAIDYKYATFTSI
jgi:hypothetical protein